MTTTKPRVLISDQMDPKAEQIFRERGCDVDVITGKTPKNSAKSSGSMMASRSVRPPS